MGKKIKPSDTQLPKPPALQPRGSGATRSSFHLVTVPFSKLRCAEKDGAAPWQRPNRGCYDPAQPSDSRNPRWHVLHLRDPAKFASQGTSVRTIADRRCLPSSGKTPLLVTQRPQGAAESIARLHRERSPLEPQQLIQLEKVPKLSVQVPFQVTAELAG